jgi:hypothetical protein
MKASLDHNLSALRAAVAEDRTAKAEALQRGLDATQPLTVARLAELCALGEKMMHTDIRRKFLLAQVSVARAAHSTR